MVDVYKHSKIACSSGLKSIFSPGLYGLLIINVIVILEVIGEKFNFAITDTIDKIPDEALQVILYGGKEKFTVESKSLGITKEYKIEFDGISNFIKNQYNESPSTSVKRWAKEFMDEIDCNECLGSRLKKEATYFRINKKNIFELSTMDISDLSVWFDDLADNLSMAWMPGASASGHSVQLRPISGAQSALVNALQPLGHVIATADGKSLAAASAVFSPSTIRTGALGRCCSASRLYSGRGAGGAFHSHCEPSHHKGRIFLPEKRQIRKSGL